MSRVLTALLGAGLHDSGVFVPGELGPLALETPATLLVCAGNGDEAMSVAKEIQVASKVVPGAAALHIEDAEKFLSEVSRGSAATKSVTLLIYLTKDIFSDGDVDVKGSVAHLVLAFMERVRHL